VERATGPLRRATSPPRHHAPGKNHVVRRLAVRKLGGKLPPRTARLAVPPGSNCIVPTLPQKPPTGPRAERLGRLPLQARRPPPQVIERSPGKSRKREWPKPLPLIESKEDAAMGS
jgi:hypothetical protein